MTISDLRQNPIDGSISWRFISGEAHQITEHYNVPGTFGFNLSDRPDLVNNPPVITEDVSGGITFNIVNMAPLNSGDVFISPNGMCMFTNDVVGKNVKVDYYGAGTLLNADMFINTSGEISSGIFSTVSGNIVNLIQQRTPVGMIGIFTQSIAPAGVLYYNGALLLRADFPYLWQWAQDQGLVDNLNAAKFGTGDEVTTFRLPDWRGLGIRGSGISSAFQMANGAYYDGGALMGVLLDAMQGHRHNIGDADNGGSISSPAALLAGGSNPFYGVGGNFFYTGNFFVGNPRSDGTNGPIRSGAETRGVSVGIHFGVFYE